MAIRVISMTAVQTFVPYHFIKLRAGGIGAENLYRSILRNKEVTSEMIGSDFFRIMRKTDFWLYCPYVKNSLRENINGNLSRNKSSSELVVSTEKTSGIIVATEKTPGMVAASEKKTAIKWGKLNRWLSWFQRFQICFLSVFDIPKRLQHDQIFKNLIYNSELINIKDVTYETI